MIERYNYLGDQNIGFYATVTPGQAILPPEFDGERVDSKTVAESFIAGTRLVGLFTAGNSNCILVPDTARDNELEKLQEAGIEFIELESNETALGNLVLATEDGAVVSPRLEHSAEKIEEALQVPVRVAEIAGLPNVGSAAVANSRGAVIHREASEGEAERVKEALGVEEVDIGTVNLGSPYVGSGALVWNQSVLVGEETSGPEIGRLDRTLMSHD
jgi:translation initiation factor 6